MRKIIISETLDQIKVGVIDNSKLTYFLIDSANQQSSIRGNIYKAKKNLSGKGIEASFVEIGENKNAFLSNFHPLKADFNTDYSDSYKTEDKNFILVQCVSDYDPRKAPKVSDFVALPSKFCVIIAKPKFFGISKKIIDEEKRSRLKTLKKFSTKNIGIILRTSAENQKLKDIKEDIRQTKAKWKEIINDFKASDIPTLIHQENNIIENIYRELLTDDTSEIQVDSRKIYNYFKKQTSNSGRNKGSIKISLSTSKKDIFNINKVDKEISRIFHKKVNLKNGSFLLVEEKEGLTVVDVNSGRSLNNKKETNLTVNLNAAKEIAHQVMLRNLSGIVLIDFIDAKNSSERNKIFKVFKDSMNKDKAKHSILPMSKFGIIEMTRQKIGNRTSSLVSEDCAVCHGSGAITRKDIICYDLIREIIFIRKSSKKANFRIEIKEELAETVAEILNNNNTNPTLKGLDIMLISKKLDENYKII
ncbi:ribonuclease E/G [bacterium]|nr:ribonuclease E/G [bacterium]